MQIMIICHHLQGLLFKLLHIGLANDEKQQLFYTLDALTKSVKLKSL
jgi:hypothetical protein